MVPDGVRFVASHSESGDEGEARRHIFGPVGLGGLTLRNRVIRAGCFEGMCQGGDVTDALIEHHRALAVGGVAMTTVGYCAISYDGRGFENEMWMRDEIVPDLRRLTDAVHQEGAAASGVLLQWIQEECIV